MAVRNRKGLFQNEHEDLVYRFQQKMIRFNYYKDCIQAYKLSKLKFSLRLRLCFLLWLTSETQRQKDLINFWAQTMWSPLHKRGHTNLNCLTRVLNKQRNTRSGEVSFIKCSVMHVCQQALASQAQRKHLILPLASKQREAAYCDCLPEFHCIFVV